MNVLFFGLGGVGQRHLRNLLKIVPQARIGAVRKQGRSFEIGDDLKPNENIDIVAQYKIEVFASLAQAKAFRPDFAIVANPTSEHASTALELVSSGIPVFLEKPISDRIDNVGELLRLSRQKNVPVMVGYMMRFHPCAAKIKEMLQDHRIGKIYSVILIVNSYMPAWHSYEPYNGFYAGQKALGGGVVLTEIHEVDLLNWYFGNPQRLWAVGGKLSGLDIDVEDTVSVLLEQESQGAKFPVNINMSFVQKAPLRKMLIQGEKGRIEWDIAASQIVVEDKSDNKQEVYDHSQLQRNDLFVAEIKHFIKCLKENSEPLTSLDKVIGGHLTALAIRDSLERGFIVEQPQLQKQVAV